MGLTWNIKEVGYKGRRKMYMHDKYITWLFEYDWYVVST